MASFNFIDAGLRDYKECWDYQEDLHSKIVSRKQMTGEPSSENYFIFVEHPHVYTLGKSGNESNLLIQNDLLKNINATFYRIDRGGDITYHGPGQIVGYPILDLGFYQLGVREFIRKMEEAIIQALSGYGISGCRREQATGVWLQEENGKLMRKICAIGVRISRSVTMHGFALNVNTDLRYFNYINPCGFSSGAVTSMQRELGYQVDVSEVKTVLKEKFNSVY